MGYTKYVSKEVEVDIDVDIDFDDVMGYINCGLDADETKIIAKALGKPNTLPNSITCPCNTIMDEIAIGELQEIINKQGVEAVVAQLKAKAYYVTQ
ncbi:hypothetical protein [Adhaeribacter aquaticus]|uniref:hypothetical protein n=1 Tax=Adhaeribacter aquaticus TaxID=299567 RepID=UPI00047C7363|nr:hypothetical protein [Adhaeribacter aquaticus]